MPRLVKLSCGGCIKPETSECNKSAFHAIVKAQNFSAFHSPNYYWVVLIDILGPGFVYENEIKVVRQMGTPFVLSIHLIASAIT